MLPNYSVIGNMLDDSSNDAAADIDSKIAYHQEMEHIAIKAGDFTKAEHHRRMEEIYMKMKEQQHPEEMARRRERFFEDR